MSVNKEEHNSASPDVKDEENSTKAEEEKAIDESSKDSGKDSVKENSAKEESGKESGKSDSEEDDDDDEEEMALLDRPVEVTGCRARKKVERLEISFSTPKEKQIDIPEGKGQKLGDCPRIEHQIQKNKVGDLKNLHRILFNRMGSANEIKKNIRRFSGFAFEKKSPEFARKKNLMEKMTQRILKNVCEVLDLERSGKSKEDIVNRILEFLLNPKDSGKQVTIKKKTGRKEKKKGAEKKTKNSEKKTKAKKEASSDEPESQDDSAAESSLGGSDEDADMSDEAPKKKSKVSKTKETPKGKAKKSDKGGDKNVKEEKKSSKGSKRKREESDGSSDDEPVASKQPSDEEIVKLVKQILDSADLQEITMKKVIEQVFDAYPECDLSHKKEFIKTTIKSVINELA